MKTTDYKMQEMAQELETIKYNMIIASPDEAYYELIKTQEQALLFCKYEKQWIDTYKTSGKTLGSSEFKNCIKNSLLKMLSKKKI